MSAATPNVFGGQLLRVAQRAGRLEQRVQSAAGRRRLGQEDVQAVEADHVLDPVRVDDRLALRDRQRVEHAGRSVAVLLERGEERGAVALRRRPCRMLQVQLEDALAGVEHPAEVMAEPAGDVLDRRSRSSGTGRARAAAATATWPGSRPARRATCGPSSSSEILLSTNSRERGQVAGRLVGEPAPDHARLQVDVEPRGDQRLVAAGHDDQLVDELVVGAAPAADLVAQRALLRFGHRLDDQHLEVRLVALGRWLVLELARIGSEDVVLVETRVLDVARRGTTPSSVPN